MGHSHKSSGEQHVQEIGRVRNSRFLVSVNLHNSATIPYQEDLSKKTHLTSTPKRRPTEPSLLVSWFARLKLLSP